MKGFSSFIYITRLLQDCLDFHASPWHHTIPSVTHLTDIYHSQHTSTTSNCNSKPHYTNVEHQKLGNLDVYGPSCYLSDTDSVCQREKKVKDDKLAAITALDTTLAIIDLPLNESMYSYILSSRINIIAFDNNGHRVAMIDIPLPVKTGQILLALNTDPCSSSSPTEPLSTPHALILGPASGKVYYPVCLNINPTVLHEDNRPPNTSTQKTLGKAQPRLNPSDITKHLKSSRTNFISL